jgi:hypothetical protein
VIPPRQTTVRPLDLGLRRAMRHAQHDVEIHRLFVVDHFRVDDVALLRT